MFDTRPEQKGVARDAGRPSVTGALISILAAALIVLIACAAPAVPQDPAAAPVVPDAKGGAGSGPQAKWDATLSRAKEESTVVVYTVSIALAEKIVPLFKSRYGITIDSLVAKPPELMPKIAAERQAGLYIPDVYIGSTEGITDYKPKGWLDPVEPALILPEVTDAKAWSGGKVPFLDKEGYAAALTGAYWSYILVNTDLVKQGEFQSYKDLASPKWKGKMIMYDPTIPGSSVFWVMFMRRIMGTEEGEKYLRDISNQDLLITRDPQLQGEWVARGKYPIAIAPSMGVVTPLLKAGAPISWVRLQEGGLVHPSGSLVMLVNRAPHPNAARVLLNFLLTEEGDRLFSQGFGQPPTRLGISAEGIDPFTVPKPGEKVFFLDESFANEVLTKGPEIARGIFGHAMK